MPPANYIAEKAKQCPCNKSDAINLWFTNTTSTLDHHHETDSYDSAGAMKYIITTLLVYSLLGISGMLLLRIRRRATRTHRVVTIREEDLQQYIKRADDLKMAGHRYKLKMDTTRMVRYLQNLERQRSITSNDTNPNDESTTLLTPIYMTGQDMRPISSPEVQPNKPSYSRHEIVTLPPLTEYYNDVTWHTSRSRTSLCKTCIALSSNSSKRCTPEKTSVDKPYSACSDNANNKIANNVVEADNEQRPDKSWQSKHVQVSHL